MLCEDFGPDSYSVALNEDPFCAAQSFCPAGKFISPDTTTAARTCEDCPNTGVLGDTHFQPSALHRTESCQEHRFCGYGEYMDPPDATKERRCYPCETGLFQISAEHREIKCTAQPKCSAGQVMKIDASNGARPRECVSCLVDEYQQVSFLLTFSWLCCCAGWSGFSFSSGSPGYRSKQPSSIGGCRALSQRAE